MIFRQERVGQDGRTFTLLKIETMKDGVVTRPWLRRLGLDEIPQLWNIARGDMRLFGPRPETVEIHRRCSERIGEVWDERLRAKPGLISLSALAQPEMRTEDRYSVAAKTHQAILDNTMIDSMGLRLRAKMLVRVPRVMLCGQTA
jgi:lipopolysaccharide/colanic/teichoic acid biosynthesis glycosyltransferase